MPIVNCIVPSIQAPQKQGVVSAINGRSVTNMVQNGNFANGTAGWANTASTFTVSNNIAYFTATAQFGKAQCQIQGSSGDKIYVKAKVKSDSNSIRLTVSYKSGYTAATISHSGSNSFETLSVVGTLPETPTSGYPKIGVDDIRSSGWTQIQVEEVMAVNLTAEFGIGNEPTKEWCDANLPWFDGSTVI